MHEKVKKVSQDLKIPKGTVTLWIKKFVRGEEFLQRGGAHNMKLNKEKKRFLIISASPGFGFNTIE